MLFEGYYSEKESGSFFKSVNNNKDNSLNNGKVFSNDIWKFNNEAKEECFVTSNARSEAFSSFLDTFPESEKAKSNDVSSWNIPFTLPMEISLDDLASAHLHNHMLSTCSSESAHPLFSEKVSSEFGTQNKIPAIEAEDKLERMDDVDREAKKPCLEAVVIGVKQLSLQERRPSSFGRVLCQKVGQSRKKMVFCDIELRCPPQIKPFDFTTASPDDIVRSSQKLRK